MKLFRTFPLSSLLLIAVLAYGCAGAMTAVSTGLTALEIVGSFYNHVVEAKAIPETLQAATIILQQADVIAEAAKNTNSPELVAKAKLLNDQANKL